MTSDPLPSTISAAAPSALYRYGWSMAIVVLATLIRIPLEPYLAPSGFIVSLAAVFIAAWIGGFWASLPMQTFVFAAEYVIFHRTEEVFLPTLRSLVHMASFYMIGSTVGLLSDFLHAAQRRAQAQRNEAMSQRNRLRITLACMGDGVIATDSQGRVTLMNPAAETMLGRTAADSLEAPVEQLFVLSGPNEELQPNPVVDLLQSGGVIHQATPVWLVRQDGSRLPIAYNAAPLEDEPGKVAGAVLVFRDESERERTERALREADQRKDVFLATLAHELRNPLAPISTGLEVLRRSLQDRDLDAAEELRSMMQRQTRHVVRLVDDLLDVSRITRGRIELRKRDADLAEVVRNAVDAVRPMIDQAGHDLTVSLPPAPVAMHVDSSRLTQVLSNLLSNAAKFTPSGGRIELVAAQQDDQIIFTVADNGAGISASEQRNIFEMFAQVAADGPQGGLGIGLTLVKQLVELHGGRVEVESPGPGGGSRFTVTIPHVQPVSAAPTPAPPVAPAPARPQASTSARRRVLVVDDNEDALRTLSKMVQILGNESFEARDGLEAVEAARELQPDIVLMDLGMPRLDGIGAAQRIRQEPWGKDLTLIATTGWGQDEDRRRTKEAGFDHHLVKPVEVVVLKSLLDGHAAPSAAAGNIS